MFVCLCVHACVFCSGEVMVWDEWSLDILKLVIKSKVKAENRFLVALSHGWKYKSWPLLMYSFFINLVNIH